MSVLEALVRRPANDGPPPWWPDDDDRGDDGDDDGDGEGVRFYLPRPWGRCSVAGDHHRPHHIPMHWFGR